MDQPLLSIVLRVVTNDAVNPGDGGAVRLVSRLTTEQRAEGWEQINAVLLARLDDPMLAFPMTRAEKEQRTFRMVLTEVDPSEWPTDEPRLQQQLAAVGPPDLQPGVTVIHDAPASPTHAADAGRSNADPDTTTQRPT
jgi:hypothetical protein